MAPTPAPASSSTSWRQGSETHPMELRPNMMQAEAVEYLQMLARTVHLDIVPLLHVKGAAPFAITREVLSYVDHLGALSAGRESTAGMTRDAKDFIESYLGRVHSSYLSGGVLLYEMYRHGTVHNFAPQAVTQGGITYYWYLYDGGRTEQIGPDDVQHLSPIRRAPGVAHLPVSTACLIQDLEAAIALFAADIEQDTNAGLLEKWNKHAAFICQPKKLR